jgi:histidine ammonia-lyase
MQETIIPGELSLAQLKRLCTVDPPEVRLDPACRPGIRASAGLVRQATDGDAAVYGVNTGFGKLAMKRIAREDLAVLQLKLLRSHAVGVGEPLPERVVRLILLLKAASLARGYSGVREEVVDGLLALHNRGVIPVIPCQGSVGASGDLAPLAHLSLPLIGEGEAYFDGRRMPAAHALELAGLQPLQLGPKEGLALINGTQVSAGLALDALLAARSRWTRRAAATARSTPASTRCAGSPGRSIARPPTGPSWWAAKSAARTWRTTTASRTRTACAASRRSWAPASTRCATRRRCWCAKPMPSPTTRWCSTA